jgi:cyclopropane-fatty-acyl-phospholipid synthase
MLASNPSGKVGEGPLRGAQSSFPFNREYMYNE